MSMYIAKKKTKAKNNYHENSQHFASTNDSKDLSDIIGVGKTLYLVDTSSIIQAVDGLKSLRQDQGLTSF